MTNHKRFLRQAVAVFDCRLSLEKARKLLIRNYAQYTESTIMKCRGAAARPKPGMAVVGAIGESDYVLASMGRLTAFLIRSGGGPRRPFGALLNAVLPARQGDFLAAQLQEGAVALWIDLTECNIDLLAYRSLKAYSDYPVGIHDLHEPPTAQERAP